jgi:hypothetical protein
MRVASGADKGELYKQRPNSGEKHQRGVVIQAVVRSLTPTILCGGVGSGLWSFSGELPQIFHLPCWRTKPPAKGFLCGTYLPFVAGVLTGNYLEKNDIVRVDNKYGRIN